MAAKPDAKVQATLSAALDKLAAVKTTSERQAVADEIVSVVKSVHLQNGLTQYKLFDSLKALSESKKNVGAREGVALVFASLIKDFGTAAEAYLIPEFPILLELYGDKTAEVRKVAEDACNALFKLCGKFSVQTLVPLLLSQLTNEKKWQTKIAALKYLGRLSEISASQVCHELPVILPDVSTCMWDTKPEVQAIAKETMTQVTKTVDNIDLEPFLPALVSCIANPDEVPECVYKLAATTFVTEVKAPTLAIMVPLLTRGLSERKPAILRQTCVIIDNMCKLVENPADAHQFLPKLMPGLDRIIEVAADPELRSVADRARSTMVRVGGGTDMSTEDPEAVLKRKTAEHQEMVDSLANNLKPAKLDTATSEYVVSLIASMYNTSSFLLTDWQAAIVPYTKYFTGNEATCKTAAEKLMKHYNEMDILRQKELIKVDTEEGETIYDGFFSLAYGGMILLNNTHLRLIRGKRYGLCGPNGVGKSTLMRAIANGQLEGFPPKDELKTVFVEHNLQAEEADLSVLDFVLSNPEFAAKRDEVQKALTDVGFDSVRIAQAVGSLSGGWKMKLELARAMLENADILLLDEPTNHLDVANVQWLVDYLTSLTNVTSMVVSHDSGFLDKVCTHITHYENRKLKTYKGNLTELVKVRPEARSYYELSAAIFKFTFPEPGFLEGIKSKDKAILKMMRVDFTYPNAPVQTLFNISLQCSLNSRVAVIGPNGAGKSTMIKLLTGELVAQTGDVWKHPNLRVAYVAQHAFHHVEMHMDKTPNEYIRWRYAYGEDRESLVKANRILSEEEEAAMKKQIVIEGEKRVLEEIVGRRKAKRSYEYEIKWVNRPYDDNTFHSRERLEEWGFTKMVQWFDEKEAAKEGMYQRPLTSAGVQKHLEDIGLAPEFSTHSRIRGLSGGQKVKVVLGAAMWNNPHMLVLDEPTNYLDRDSLGALAGAIQEFGGGVVIISHNREFTGAICPEVWNVEAGHLTISGAKQSMAMEKIEMKEQETVTDAFGNVSKVKSTRKLTRKELKAKEKRRAQKIKNGEPLSESEEEL